MKGNPNWGNKADGTGKSGNPGGFPGRRKEFRAECLKMLDEDVIQAWKDELTIRERPVTLKDGTKVMVQSRGPEWVQVSKLVTAYAVGMPSQSVRVDGEITVRKAEDLTDDELAEVIAGESAGTVQ